jgi:hypothetical protein
LIAAGVAAHGFWNSPILSGLLGDGDSVVGWLAYVTAKGLPMLIGLILVVQMARERERRWFADLAAGFADDGSITPAELAQLSGLRARRRARIAAGRAYGQRGGRLLGRLQRGQLGLAMAYSRFRSEDHPEVARRIAGIAAMRAEYARLGSPCCPSAGRSVHTGTDPAACTDVVCDRRQSPEECQWPSARLTCSRSGSDHRARTRSDPCAPRADSPAGSRSASSSPPQSACASSCSDRSAPRDEGTAPTRQ